jgi:RNA recognition motif-containing protein
VKLYVGNLSKQITEAQFTDLLKPFGKAEKVGIAKDKATGESRGFGFAEFPDATEANAAIAGLNGKMVEGQALKVNEARSK